jgi:hypothetical protein
MMRLRHSLTALVLATAVGTGVARADWLGDTWSKESVMNGDPAIGITDSVIRVVLPSATLDQAYAEGLSTEDVLGAFLDRYGQRCSHLIDLNVPHRDLKVELWLQNRTRLEDVSNKDDVLAALRDAYRAQRPDDETPLLFVVSPVHFDYTIDYVPARRVRCVAPGDESPAS